MCRNRNPSAGVSSFLILCQCYIKHVLEPSLLYVDLVVRDFLTLEETGQLQQQRHRISFRRLFQTAGGNVLTKCSHWTGSTPGTWVYAAMIPTRWCSSNANSLPIFVPETGQNGVFAATVFTMNQGCGPASPKPTPAHCATHVARNGKASAQARCNKR